MRDDDDNGKPTPDSDRAAILARRKQFIALALSGLTTTVACTDGDVPAPKKSQDQQQTEQKPQPCLTVSMDPPPDQLPRVCLSIAPPTEPDPELVPVPESVPVPEEVRPQVCLKMVRPAEDQPKPEPKPQPCLKKPAPKPCLKIAPESG